MTIPNLASYLDFANHHPQSGKKEIKTICDAVAKFGFNASFVNPCWVKFAKTELKNLKVGTIVSFPLGQDTTETKIFAVNENLKKGADELDIATNSGFLKNDPDLYLKELKRIVQAVKINHPRAIIKFIIEAGLLTDEEIKTSAKLILESQADFIKICSGLGPRGATLKDVALVKSAIQDKIKIKVAGGIHTFTQVQDFLKAGASRIGTSKAIEILSNK